MSDAQSLQSILAPKTIAVVGATDDGSKLRGRLMTTLLRGGFEGTVYPVNPSHKTVAGLTAYPDLDALPECADLALVAVPAKQVPAILEQAANGCARSAVIFSAGFDLDTASQSIGPGKVRVIGPNSEGFFLPGRNLAATFAPAVDAFLGRRTGKAAPGRPISIVSQSGGLGFSLFSRGAREHLDFHSVITTGNECDLECLDFVDLLIEEGEVGVILMFIEGLKNAANLVPLAAKAADRGVQLVAMKAGRSEAGQRAVVSHTAHLAGGDEAYASVFERCGIIRVSDVEETISAAAAFSRLAPASGRKTAIITTSGGAGVLAADICAAHSIETPPLSDALQSEISKKIPNFGSSSNPVDATAQAAEGDCAALIDIADIVLSSDEVDAAILNFGLSKPGRIEALRSRLETFGRKTDKPVLFHSHTLPLDENLSALADLGFHGFSSLRGCAFALDILNKYAEFKASRTTVALSADYPKWPAENVTGVLGAKDSAAILEHYGIPSPPMIVAETPEQALSAADRLGYPVAVKIASPNIPHKTDAGCVELNIGRDILTDTCDRILNNARRYDASASLEGVQIQKMVAPGIELALGVVCYPEFGPLVMLATGGIYIEVFNDAVLSPLPIAKPSALQMVQKLKSYPILRGVRGRPPFDVDALADLIVSVAAMAQNEAGRLEQLDLNPVFVYPEGDGVIAVDSLVVFK